MKRENFYRRSPDDALAGMVGMTLEERGVYNTVIDLIYLTWRPLEDSRAYIAAHCGCAVQRLNPILNRLIERGKRVFELTPEGKKLSARLMQVSLQRQERLFKNFAKADKTRLHALLNQLSQDLTGDWEQ